MIETARLNKRLAKDHLLSAKALMAAYKNIMQTGSLKSLKWIETVFSEAIVIKDCSKT